MVKDKIGIKGKVVLVLKNIHTGKKRVFESENIVTDTGDIYYAQVASSETPTNAFGIMELGSAGNAPAKTSDRSDVTTTITNSQKAFDSGFPKANDTSANNTGGGTDVVTYLVTYIPAEANDSAIDRVIITNTAPGASEPVLMYATFTAVEKTTSDSLEVFVNHTMTGV